VFKADLVDNLGESLVHQTAEAEDDLDELEIWEVCVSSSPS
jgi:hypothetical protein